VNGVVINYAYDGWVESGRREEWGTFGDGECSMYQLGRFRGGRAQFTVPLKG